MNVQNSHKENSHKEHRKRVKNRFLVEGLDAFDDHQVLELLLFFSVPLKDTNELAHQLIKRYGSLSGVFEADPSDLATNDGIGEHSAALLSLIPSVTRRYMKDRWGERPLLNSTTKAGEYVTSLCAGKNYEVFYVICLDAQCRVIFPALAHEGTINQAPVYPRIIVETALRHKAHSVILAHNHPGGSSNPSKQDIEVTQNITAALKSISIQVVDHIIAAGENFTSFAEKGIL
ncbi:RadC family protein [Dehalobacterium formicoaceticum]|uniref:DNA repair protein RadC n=1 Tax=Dehalobacterium formicoaceticum TaxID=51515 RepID=A0ABT1Y5M1_9FIRM|nr:DNA repair protein RadC [Dehalobacterium formicoaceticum]MCR6546180.1 DNA repair protein RadC [Dehalobacterium formicoaceticum]